MAYNSFATNDANAVKYWSRRLEFETAKALEISRLMGEGEDSIIQVQSELTKDTGDKVTFDLLMQLTGDGFTENETMEGSEESFTFYPDSLLINELHNSVRFPARANINQQRVPWNLRDKAKTALREWFKVRYTKSFFNQVCGNTVTGLSTKYLGNNAAIAPTSGRIIRPASAAADETMTSDTYKFDLRMLNYAKEVAETADPMIRPIDVDGEACYVVYLDPRQITDLQTNAGSGQWLEIMMAIQNGFGKDSDIVTGAIGKYNGMILRKAPDNALPNGVNSSTFAAVSNTRRAVLLGAQAAVAAWSSGGGPSRYSWAEEGFDYGRQGGIGAGTIYGMKKTVYNSVDYGTVVISTYAPDHTTTP